MNTASRSNPIYPVLMCALAAMLMGYGWGYRGIVGHEGGAMVPGAMLGMAICLASGRADWHRRAAVAGLFGAVGWAWGGSMSYMEHPKYTMSDSFPDVLYGYAALFFIGALWAGCGGALLGMALTESRSKLRRFVGPFSAVAIAYMLIYILFVYAPEIKDGYNDYTMDHWHDGDWGAALVAMVVSGIYALVRPNVRKEAGLIFLCSVGWWIGYGGLTKLGGVLLAPPNRSESWSGVLGILVVLLVYLRRTGNRAAFLLALYGILGGGLAFALAVFIRHPFDLQWGIFDLGFRAPSWKIAEESFGFFMGLALALGALRLLRGNLAPPDEDEPGKPLDIYAVFFILIGLSWVNTRRAPMDWMFRYLTVPTDPIFGIHPGYWFLVGGLLFSAVGVYALYLYSRDELTIIPQSTYGKGVLVFLFLIWMPSLAGFIQNAHGFAGGRFLMEMSYWLATSISTLLVFAHASKAEKAGVPADATVSRGDASWRPSVRFWVLAGMTPMLLLLFTAGSTYMSDGWYGVHRKRFGEDAYYKQIDRMIGKWQVVGLVGGTNETEIVPGTPPLRSIDFQSNGRNVIITRADGTVEDGIHRWRHSNVYIELRWWDRDPDADKHVINRLDFLEDKLYITWPPVPDPRHRDVSEGVMLLERVDAAT
jgi:hypothetical protein